MISDDAVAIRRATRRDFAKQAILLPLCVGAVAARAPDQKEESLSPARTLTDFMKSRFPERLSNEEWKTLQKKVEAGLRSAAQLSSFKLKNGDEPAFVFHARDAE
jgi:hypothetical protein